LSLKYTYKNVEWHAKRYKSSAESGRDYGGKTSECLIGNTQKFLQGKATKLKVKTGPLFSTPWHEWLIVLTLSYKSIFTTHTRGVTSARLR